MSKYITKVTSIYFVDDLGDEKFIWKCTALPNAYTICEILNADLIKNGMYSIWKYKELIEKNQQITDLEAKLAESEKRFIVANNLRKNSDEVLLNYKTEKYGLDKTIQELRKIKLSFPEKEWYYKGFENCERQMSRHIADLTLEVKQLKQQLAEKEKEILDVKNWWSYQYNGEIERHNQDKISFAVEQLEKVKEKVKKNNGRVQKGNGCEQFKIGYETSWLDSLLKIDNQIDELKKKGE